jgi:hypothetical protein
MLGAINTSGLMDNTMFMKKVPILDRYSPLFLEHKIFIKGIKLGLNHVVKYLKNR